MANNTAKKLAKNTAFMYVRMFVLMLISLYTSRVVLQTLGVEDFGIYNLVGSIVAMFNSLRVLFASSTQRYLNYEMGRGDNSKLNTVFSMSIIINLVISVVFIALVEIIGVIFFEYYINVPDNRFIAAMYVFQFSIMSAVLSIITTSYDAVIIAHEKMGFFAYMSIIEGFLKLGVVFLLLVSPIDKLIYYGFLILFVALLVLIINSVYCIRHFPESRFRFEWDKKYLRDMTSFAGWNFFGNTAFALTQNGVNMLLNVFGGPVVNASRGVSYQVKNILEQFQRNVAVVINPHCIKTYASGAMDSFYNVVFFSTKIYFFIQVCLAIPLIYLTEDILQLWLGNVPEYGCLFVQLLVFYSIVRSAHPSIDIVFKASGSLRKYQLTEAILQSMPLFFSFFFLKVGYGYGIVFVMMILFECVDFILITIIAYKQAGLPIIDYFKKVILKCVVCIGFCVTLFCCSTMFDFDLVGRILNTITQMTLAIIFMILVLFKNSELNLVKSLIRK